MIATAVLCIVLALVVGAWWGERRAAQVAASFAEERLRRIRNLAVGAFVQVLHRRALHAFATRDVTWWVRLDGDPARPPSSYAEAISLEVRAGNRKWRYTWSLEVAATYGDDDMAVHLIDGVLSRLVNKHMLNAEASDAAARVTGANMPDHLPPQRFV
jgi:hypothetical protein